MPFASSTRRTLLVAAILLSGHAVTAVAAPCAGFTDVDSSNPFCINVTWLKGRSITLGCSSTTLFCPAQGVPRLQMAAFLNRLGNALAPVIVTATGSGANDLNLDATEVICPSSPIALAATGVVSRTGLLNAALHVGPAAGTADVAVRFVESTNGGTVWTLISSPIIASTRAGGGTASLHVQTAVAINTGVNYRFALQVSRPLSSTNTGATGPWSCQLRAEGENFKQFNGGPFDLD